MDEAVLRGEGVSESKTVLAGEQGCRKVAVRAKELAGQPGFRKNGCKHVSTWTTGMILIKFNTPHQPGLMGHSLDFWKRSLDYWDDFN